MRGKYTTLAEARVAQREERLVVALERLAASASGNDPAAIETARLWSDPGWLAIVHYHRATKLPRPKIGTVAKAMDLGTAALRTRLRRLGIKDWRVVHDLVAAGPPEPRE